MSSHSGLACSEESSSGRKGHVTGAGVSGSAVTQQITAFSTEGLREEACCNVKYTVCVTCQQKSSYRLRMFFCHPHVFLQDLTLTARQQSPAESAINQITEYMRLYKTMKFIRTKRTEVHYTSSKSDSVSTEG